MKLLIPKKFIVKMYKNKNIRYCKTNSFFAQIQNLKGHRSFFFTLCTKNNNFFGFIFRVILPMIHFFRSFFFTRRLFDNVSF